jgi:hypothetical protein
MYKGGAKLSVGGASVNVGANVNVGGAANIKVSAKKNDDSSGSDSSESTSSSSLSQEKPDSHARAELKGEIKGLKAEAGVAVTDEKQIVAHKEEVKGNLSLGVKTQAVNVGITKSGSANGGIKANETSEESSSEGSESESGGKIPQAKIEGKSKHQNFHFKNNQ